MKPIRERRQQFAQDPQAVMQMLKEGTAHTREVTAQTMEKVRQAMCLEY